MNCDSTDGSRVVVFGVSDLAMVAHAYLTHDSPHTVVAFTAHRKYITGDTLVGLPVVAFEDLESAFPASHNRMFALMSARDSNRARTPVFDEARHMGYRFISYVSSKSQTWPDVAVGENTAILEGAIVNPYAALGSNVVVGPGVVIGHHSRVGDHCFISARAVILGNVSVGERATIGANTTVREGIVIPAECTVAPASYIADSITPGCLYARGVRRGARRSRG